MYLDANVLCFARDRASQKYQTARVIIGELLIQQVNIFKSDLVLDEVGWALLKGWYKADTGNELYPRSIKNDHTILPRYYRKLKLNTTKILRTPNLKILPSNGLSKNRITTTLNFLTSNNNLMPRDAFHLAFASLYNIEGFITSERDFDNLNSPLNLTLYKYKREKRYTD